MPRRVARDLIAGLAAIAMAGVLASLAALGGLATCPSRLLALTPSGLTVVRLFSTVRVGRDTPAEPTSIAWAAPGLILVVVAFSLLFYLT